jgi:hypothetical protein
LCKIIGEGRPEEWNTSIEGEEERFLMEANRRTSSQNKGEEGGQKNGTGALTLVEGGFLIIESNRKSTTRARREFRRLGNQSKLTLLEGVFLM